MCSAERGDAPFSSIDDLWRRAKLPRAVLVELAEADAYNASLGVSRREARWSIKALRDEPLPLFAAAAERETRTVTEQVEPVVRLRAMTEGKEVVEDYGHVGLTLRQHPVSFLRADLARRRVITCAEAMASRDRRWVEVAELVLVRQRPGSAKGVMFITIEDETGVANLVVWTKVFEANRRTVLDAGMIGVRGRVQREGEVVHLIAHSLTDLSGEFASVGLRGRSGEGPAPATAPAAPRMPLPKVMADPHRHIDEIRVKTRDFR